METTAVPLLLEQSGVLLSTIHENLNDLTRLAVSESVVKPLVQYTDDFFTRRRPHYLILRILWFIALLAGLTYHAFVMAGPMHFWGRANGLFVTISVFTFLQSMDAVFLMIDWAHWLRKFNFLRTLHLIGAYIGAIWWLGAAIGEIIYLWLGTEFMSNVGQMVTAYMLMLTSASFVPNITIIFKEAFGNDWFEHIEEEDTMKKQEVVDDSNNYYHMTHPEHLHNEKDLPYEQKQSSYSSHTVVSPEKNHSTHAPVTIEEEASHDFLNPEAPYHPFHHADSTNG